ncbi:protein of unknown function [Methylocaldum szegediense]|uniref:Uncharacterized protein n=1 Tax=Methylocaldum szegediense TaxID=73780 RepID=A0ABM9I6M6_9GAMM|nr:protein of unknown function [Methylocaldum szegediense]
MHSLLHPGMWLRIQAFSGLSDEHCKKYAGELSRGVHALDHNTRIRATLLAAHRRGTLRHLGSNLVSPGLFCLF